MSQCTVVYRADGEQRRCPRATHGTGDRCLFHMSPEDRQRAGISGDDLRDAFRSDLGADDQRHREYADITLECLDLSALVVDGAGTGQIRFRNVTVEETLDFSGSMVRHPVVLEDCRVGRLEMTEATFENDVTVTDSRLEGETRASLRCRRTSFERSVRIADSELEGGVEFAACGVGDWFDVDGVTVSGRAHFPNASLGRAQFVDTEFESAVGFEGMAGSHVTFERVRFGDRPEFTDATVDTLRMHPTGAVECRFRDATLLGGRLAQPENGSALYDLTDATVGDIDIDCDTETFEHYRFYRTQFDGFPFPAYRRFLRTNRWRLHGYAGTTDEPVDVEGLERTYLEAKQGASAVGDTENASAFFLRELRYRRRRYAAHATDPENAAVHRFDATVRWLTNGFLDLVAGYGERPQRIVAVSVAVILGGAVVYPATGGLASESSVVTYATDGPLALVDGLYFSIVTFATLGLGDIQPVGDVGRMLAASEALVGAFLTALFVFSLGRRVSR